ncbi:MAG: hypothetical protein ACFFD6_11505, partial [Candidatus Thorarchaeota archaeon]
MGVRGWSDLIPWTWTSSDEVVPGRIAFDMPNYLTRRISVMRASSAEGGRIPLQHVGMTLSLVRVCLKLNTLPVLVFDGPPEQMKRSPNPDLVLMAQSLYKQFAETADPFDEEISKELRRSPSIRMYFAAEHVRELGRVLGLPTLTAPSEAELYAAIMCREGLVNTVVSNDSDALLFGSPHVTRQLQLSRNVIQRATLRELEINASLDLEGLRDLAIVCGCDFHKEGVKGIGPRKGSVLLQRYGGLEGLLKSRGYGRRDREPFIQAREVFDEAGYISVAGVSPRLNPPIIPRLVRMLTSHMAEERAEEIGRQLIGLWREFGSRQE